MGVDLWGWEWDGVKWGESGERDDEFSGHYTGAGSTLFLSEERPSSCAGLY